jgi:geranylgeranyl diphosphate synthase, type II
MSSKKALTENILKPYQQKVLAAIEKSIPFLGSKTPVRDACEYALMNGGKRLRPALVLMFAKALGHPIDLNPAALCVEYFHTSSLVADDLPCMDDDDERRSKPSVHKKYGDTTALLVSYALIAAGYGFLVENTEILKKANLPFSNKSDQICVLALENATYNTGLNGATGGQFLDIFPPNLSLSTLREVIHKKTVSLFEISFVLGWLFGGGDLSDLPTVKKAASHFGTAFQIADDVDDMQQDKENERKVNFACCFGKQIAVKTIEEEILQYKQTLIDLRLHQTELANLTDIVL